MKNSTQQDFTLDDVIDYFSLERETNPDALEKVSAQFPQFKDSLTEFAGMLAIAEKAPYTEPSPEYMKRLEDLGAATVRGLLRGKDAGWDEGLEWAAKWIEGSLSGETNERTIEFANNMAMSLRAAKKVRPPS